MMKIAKISLSIITMAFALLGLLHILSFDIANPIMLFTLATLFVLRSIEYRRNGDSINFAVTMLTALFIYATIIYTVFIGS